MGVSVTDDSDPRVLAFLNERHDEAFLLNVLPSGLDELRIMSTSESGNVTALATVTGTVMRLQMPNGYDQPLLIRALDEAGRIGKGPEHVICHSSYRQRVAMDLVERDLKARLSDEATFFVANIHELRCEHPAGRRARPADAEALSNLLRTELFPGEDNNGPADALAQLRCSEDQQFWVLEDGGQIVALGGIAEHRDGSAKIEGVLTREGHRGRGYAPKLITSFLAATHKTQGFSKAVLLARNDPARRCYDSMGFRRIGEFSTLDL
jgi:RimJ/RimL family protein N-acetyltransferase